MVVFRPLLHIKNGNLSREGEKVEAGLKINKNVTIRHKPGIIVIANSKFLL